MITSLMTTGASLMTLMLPFVKSPVKMSLTILAISSSAMLTLAKCTGSSWLPMIMYMLFMGGILVLFMIISSLNPNAKSKKIKSPMILFWMMAFSILSLKTLEMTESVLPSTKTILSEKSSMILALVLMLMYFLTFLSILTEQSYPMRSFQ